ncbi:hypothetical protein BC936DRAFT_147232 [Jimgerdemannia flammicorona]|uniref:BZIP domain-containing protein n=1 Tax=Jimgerdemannia flammicorona TaxID=994334 RepID=A0A433D5U9_9FUNG|nr:hypothetical protein BC936DRAFT_147232 [Jimgerdemannia flammicorona]
MNQGLHVNKDHEREATPKTIHHHNPQHPYSRVNKPTMSGYTPYTSYISALNGLSPDNSPTLSQEDLADDLALWTNAQFTFDMPPGIGIYDDETFDLNKLSQQQQQPQQQQPSSLPKSESMDNVDEPVTYEGLAEYLDYELPHKQDQQQQQQQQAIPLASLHSRSRHNSATRAQPATALLQPFVIPHPPAPTTGVPTINTRIAPAPASTTSSPTTTSFPAIFPAPTAYIAAAPALKPVAVAYSAPLLLAKQPSPSAALPYMGVSALPAAGPASTKRRHASIDSTSMIGSTTPSEAGSPGPDELVDPDTASKLAAEEDKRRRNTAASARFRIKKKQREQALERTAREMSSKADLLENRVRELEMEIKWLRGLIVEKDSRLLDLAEGKAPPKSDEPAGKKVKTDGEEAAK